MAKSLYASLFGLASIFTGIAIYSEWQTGEISGPIFLLMVIVLVIVFGGFLVALSDMLSG